MTQVVSKNIRIRSLLTLLALWALLLLSACNGDSGNYTLTLAHLNDTHSHLEPAAMTLTINGEKTTVESGGFARLKTVIDQMRAEDPNLLLLHGGDAVQGTLYFTLFTGAVEFDFLNLLGVNAMTFGNHEFDKGIAPIPGWIKRSNFPWLSANIDFSGEPTVATLVTPYVIKEVNGQKVAIIGATTESTPQITIDVGNAIFKDAVVSTQQQVSVLTALGINKIILLSHLGYAQDKALASHVAGVDIIVGGHSHSLLGTERDLSLLGLIPDGPYPTEATGADGKRVVVLQAGQWGDVVGRLQVTFSPAGEVTGYNAGAVIPVGEKFTRGGVMVLPGTQAYLDIVDVLKQSGIARIIKEDSVVATLLAPYTQQVDAFRSVRVATAANDIVRGLNSGPGPLIADSMLAAVPRARVALMNFGGVRKDLAAGTISEVDVQEVLPFASTMVLVDLTGAELKNSLEEGIDFLVTRYPQQIPPYIPYVGGIRLTVQPSAAKGSRVGTLAVKDAGGVYQPLLDTVVYSTVVNSFVAGGGDGFTTVKNVTRYRNDTGIIDSDTFREYLKGLGTVSNPTEQRITMLPDR